MCKFAPKGVAAQLSPFLVLTYTIYSVTNQQTHDVKTTSYQRRCDVVDVDMTLF